jgi:hypothetical protein
VTVRSLERVAQIPDFRVRFAEPQQCRPLEPEELAAAGAAAVEREVRPGGDWFARWSDELFASLRFSDHESLSQPVSTILLVSSAEPEPLSQFESLIHVSNMPAACQKHVLDPNCVRMKILLHDCTGGVPADRQAQPTYAVMRKTYAAATCHLLELYQGGGDVSGIFGASATLLGPKDVTNLRNIYREVVTACALPWMERKLQQLDAQIAQSRKGLKNQIKYLWRKSREEEDQKGAAGVYTLQDVEAQLRLSADLAFHCHDYELAATLCKRVLPDFNQDKSVKHAAAAYELLGVCQFLLNNPKADWEKNMERAYEQYSKGQGGLNLAARACLLACAMSPGKDAAQRLVKLNADLPDAPLRMALLLEQAGLQYSKTGQRRKGLFHLVLAGHTFNKAGQKRLALHAYERVLPAFTARWAHITDHIHFTMARLAFSVQRYEESLQHFVALLNTFALNRVVVNPEREVTYFREFLYAVKTWNAQDPKNAEVFLDLKLPLVASEAKVLPYGEIVGPKMQIPGVSREEMKTLRASAFRMAAGHPVRVEVSISNPTQLQLDLSIRLTASHDKGEAVELPAQSVTLVPKESSTIVLTAISTEGTLRITGTSWRLFDSCQSRSTFPTPYEVTVLKRLPVLRINVEVPPPPWLHGRTEPSALVIENAGDEQVDVKGYVSHPNYMRLEDTEAALAPGETRRLTGQCTAGTCGDLELLWCLRAVVSGEDDPNFRSWTAVKTSLQVQPSLYIKASLRPGVRDLMSNWAAIELLNESPHPLEIEGAQLDGAPLAEAVTTQTRPVAFSGQPMHMLFKLPSAPLAGRQLAVLWRSGEQRGSVPVRDVSSPDSSLISSLIKARIDAATEMPWQNDSAEVVLEVCNPSPSAMQVTVTAERGPVFFVGEEKRLVTLDAGAAATFPFHVIFPRPGVYNLNQFNFAMGAMTFHLPFESLVLVG